MSAKTKKFSASCKKQKQIMQLIDMVCKSISLPSKKSTTIPLCKIFVEIDDMQVIASDTYHTPARSLLPIVSPITMQV